MSDRYPYNDDSDCEIASYRATIATLTAERDAAVRERDALADRVITHANEEHGPFPVQTADVAMTCIERGAFEKRQAAEALRRERDEALHSRDAARLALEALAKTVWR